MLGPGIRANGSILAPRRANGTILAPGIRANGTILAPRIGQGKRDNPGSRDQGKRDNPGSQEGKRDNPGSQDQGNGTFGGPPGATVKMRPLSVANSTSVSDNRLEPWLGLIGNSLNGSLNNSLNNSLNGAQVVADVGVLSPPFTLLSVTTIYNDNTPRWADRPDNPGSQDQGNGTFGGPPGATVKMRPLSVANSTSVSDNRLEPWLGLIGNSLNGSLNNSANNSLNGAQVVADVGVLSPPFTLLSVTTIYNDNTPRWADRPDNPGSQGQGNGTFGGPPGATVKMRPLSVANSTSVSDNRLEPWLGLIGNSLNGSLNNSANNSLNGAQVVADVGVLSPPFTLLSVTTIYNDNTPRWADRPDNPGSQGQGNGTFGGPPGATVKMRPLSVANSTSVSDNRLEPWLGLIGNSLNGSLNNSLNNSLNGAQVVADVGVLSPPFTLLSVTTIYNDNTPRWADRPDNPGSQDQGNGTFGGPPGATVKMRPLSVANSTSVSDNRLEPWLGLIGNSLNGSLNNSLNNSLNGAQVVADVGVLSPPFTLLSVTTIYNDNTPRWADRPDNPGSQDQGNGTFGGPPGATVKMRPLSVANSTSVSDNRLEPWLGLIGNSLNGSLNNSANNSLNGAQVVADVGVLSPPFTLLSVTTIYNDNTPR